MAHILLESPCVDYVAEFHQQCVDRIKKELGPRDEVLEVFSDPYASKLVETIQNAATAKEVEFDFGCMNTISFQDIIDALNYQNFPWEKVTKWMLRSNNKMKGVSLRFLIEHCPKL